MIVYMQSIISSLLTRIRAGEVLVSDGAWGTILQARGLKPGECPELWCVEHRADVLAVARGYVEAGADLIETNSFGGSSFKLAHYGLSDRVAELNRAAAAISREAAGPERYVLGSIGPTGKMLLMGDVTEAELSDAFGEQALALAAGGVDAACIETMSALDEALLAVRAVQARTSLTVACTFTFDHIAGTEFRTMMGLSPAEMARGLLDAGTDIIGANCGNGFEAMLEIVRQIRGVTADTPILVHANAGVPRQVGGRDVFPESPADMAQRVSGLIDAGANIIGGCCGTTPAHIAAIAAAVGALHFSGDARHLR